MKIQKDIGEHQHPCKQDFPIHCHEDGIEHHHQKSDQMADFRMGHLLSDLSQAIHTSAVAEANIRIEKPEKCLHRSPPNEADSDGFIDSFTPDEIHVGKPLVKWLLVNCQVDDKPNGPRANHEDDAKKEEYKNVHGVCSDKISFAIKIELQYRIPDLW